MTPLRWENEFLINTVTAGSQDESALAALADGRFVVVWEDSSQSSDDPSWTAVRGQLFAAGGSKAGTEFLVNTTTSNHQVDPAVASLADGRYVVVWQDGSQSPDDPSWAAVRGQMFAADGSKWSSEFLVNTTTTNWQGRPAVTGLKDGRFVVMWTDETDSPGSVVRGQMFAANGWKVGSEFAVSANTDTFNGLPSVTSLTNGGFVAVWSRHDSAHSYGQVFAPDGSKLGAEFLVPSAESQPAPPHPSVTALASGGFVAIWWDLREDALDPLGSIRGQVFDASGAKSGTEFLVNTTTHDVQFSPSVAGLIDGGFVVVWADSSGAGEDVSGTAVRGQVFDANGAKSGAEFLVNTTTAGDQAEPSVEVLADGRFVVSWTDVSYSSDDQFSAAVRGQIFDSRAGPVVLEGTPRGDHYFGTSFGDQMSGYGGRDTFEGRGGKDSLLGGSDQDSLIGGAGADVLRGGGGNDILEGGIGADSLYGGPGFDTVDYGKSDAAVTISLWKGQGTGGHAEGDTLGGIEHVIGTRFDDNIIGDNGPQRLNGGSGFDSLDGHYGGDTLIGGSGTDRLFGDRGSDFLSGGRGRDTLIGGSGNDTLIGGSGSDTFLFRPGADRDSIRSFQDGLDRIDVRAFGYASASDVLALAAQEGSDVTITDGTDKITLVNFSLSNLDGGDFII